MKSLNRLGEEQRKIVVQKGHKVLHRQDWEDDFLVPAYLALIHTEVSEATEEFRKNNIEEFKKEMVDIILRTLNVACAFDDDIYQTLVDKIEFNRRRPHKHGGKRI